VTDTSSRPWNGLNHKHQAMIIRCHPDHTNTSNDPLCPSCADHLGGILDDIPALLRDLNTAIIRDVRFVEHGTMPAAHTIDEDEAALPWDDRAARAKAQLSYDLRQAATLIKVVGLRTPAIARQLRARLGRLARQPAMPDHAHKISKAAARAHAVIDRPPSPWYYGPCPYCHLDIFTDRVDENDRDARVSCPRDGCGYSAHPSDHRSKQLDAGDDRWLTIGELVGAITSAGETVTRDQIKGWIRREGLPREFTSRPRWTDGVLVPYEVYVYRLGDVRRLALEAEARRDLINRKDPA
jgi:hypothetical protein